MCCPLEISSRWLFNFHAFDEVVLKHVSMGYNPICNNGSLQIENQLMNFHHDATGPILFKAQRFNMGIDNTPLPGPVLANRQMAAYRPAFHAVRPLDLRMHRRQCRVDVAAIEGGVCGFQEIMILHDYSFSKQVEYPGGKGNSNS